MRTNLFYEEKESLKAEFDYDTSCWLCIGAYPGTKGRLLRLEKEWAAQRSRKKSVKSMLKTRCPKAITIICHSTARQKKGHLPKTS
jgi:hypothetical protein